MTRSRRGIVATTTLVVAGCGHGATSPSSASTPFHWESGPTIYLPHNWVGLGSGTIEGDQYTDATRRAHPVNQTRFWPMILSNAFMNNDASELAVGFASHSAYVMVVDTKTDPVPGSVSPSFAAGSGVLRRSWTPGRRCFSIAYIGGSVSSAVITQADEIRSSARC